MKTRWSSARFVDCSHLVQVALILMAAAVAHANVPPGIGSPQLTALPNEQGEPWLLLRSEVPAAASKAGADAIVATEPRSLAVADLDGNGVPDLVAGYATTNGGMLLYYRGDVTSYPTRDEAPPLLPPLRVDTVLSPDWVAAGDFDADGHQDLVLAARDGSELAFYAGDGGGGLGDAELVTLPGGVTALAVGEVNRRDALADLAVAVMRDEEALVLVFESPRGALAAEPEVFTAPTAISDLGFGELDGGSGRELAAVSGDQLIIIRGRDRQLSWPEATRETVPPARVERTTLGSPAVALELARFTRSPHEQVAVLGDDGRLTVLAFGDDSQLSEVAAVDIEGEVGTRPLLISGRVSSRAHADLVIATGAHSRLEVLNLGGRWDQQQRPAKTLTIITGTVPIASRPAAVLPVRFNLDALDDLVVLPLAGASPQVMMTAPLTTFTVNSTNDIDDGSCNVSHCSLREAINSANQGEAADLIAFNVSGQAIKPSSAALPSLVMPVTVDGRQGGACPGSCYPTDLDGDLCPDVVCTGLRIYGGGIAVSRMVIHGFSGDGLSISGGANVVIELSRLGVDFNGDPDGNGSSGIAISSGASNVTIGGATTTGNVISDNSGSGLSITGSSGSPTSAVVSGNLIGTGVGGNTAMGNRGNAVSIGSYAEGCDIGSTTARNVIAASTAANTGGVKITSSTAQDTLIVNNLIGLGADGATELGNRMGIDLPYANNLTIGGTTSAHRNTISASSSYGIWIHASTVVGSQIQGNYVGTNAAGTAAAGNNGGSRAAIVVEASDDVMIGGAVSGAGNLISGNGSSGILIWPDGVGNHAERCNVLGNLIGVNAAGTAAVANDGHGVSIIGPDNVIGSSTATGNTISGNLRAGIRLSCAGGSDCDGNSIKGNRIGVAAGSSSAIGNAEDGIQIYNNLGDTQIGGANTGDFNTIAHNGGAGVLIYGSSGANGHRIQKNYIFGNTGLGIDLGDGSGADGVTANDVADSDSGPNGYQNFPVITAWDAGAHALSFTLDSSPSSTFTVELFATETCDGSGHGEGELVMPSTTISTDATGFGSKTITTTALPSTWSITARATNLSGNTSEFSPCVPAAGYTSPLIFADGFEIGSTLRWSASVP